AMTVIGVFAKANVSDDQQLRRGVLRGLHRLLHDAAVAVRIAAERIFLGRNTEQNNAAESELCRLAGFLGDVVYRKLGLTGHRRDWLANAFSGTGKQREDQLLRVQPNLLHQSTDRRMVAESTQAGRGETVVWHMSVIIQRDQERKCLRNTFSCHGTKIRPA